MHGRIQRGANGISREVWLFQLSYKILSQKCVCAKQKLLPEIKNFVFGKDNLLPQRQFASHFGFVLPFVLGVDKHLKI